MVLESVEDVCFLALLCQFFVIPDRDRPFDPGGALLGQARESRQAKLPFCYDAAQHGARGTTSQNASFDSARLHGHERASVCLRARCAAWSHATTSRGASKAHVNARS